MEEQKPLPSILLLRLSSLGDIVQALPLASMLCGRGHRVGWLLESRFAELPSLVNLPVQWEIWERGWRSTLRLRRRRGSYDVVCDLQGNWKSAFCAYAIAGKGAWRADKNQLRESASAWIPSRHARASLDPHVLGRSWKVLEAALDLSSGPEELPLPPFLEAAGEVCDDLSHRLLALGIQPGCPFVVQVLGLPQDPRTWPLRAHLRLESDLDLPHVLLAGPGESALALPTGLPILRQREGELLELVALGQLLARSGGVAVGHDGGAMHVLRAAGARTLFLFGPQDPTRTGPLGQRVIQADVDLPCRPCMSRRCHLPEGNLCMDKIPVEVVRRELSRRIGGG